MNTGRARKYLKNSKWALTLGFLGAVRPAVESCYDLTSQVGGGERKHCLGAPFYSEASKSNFIFILACPFLILQGGPRRTGCNSAIVRAPGRLPGAKGVAPVLSSGTLCTFQSLCFPVYKMGMIIHLFNRYLVSTYYVLGAVLDIWKTSVNKTGKNSCLPGAVTSAGRDYR